MAAWITGFFGDMNLQTRWITFFWSAHFHARVLHNLNHIPKYLTKYLVELIRACGMPSIQIQLVVGTEQHWVKQNSHIYIDVLHEWVLLRVDEESTSRSLPYVRLRRYGPLYPIYTTDFSKTLSTTLWYSLHPPKISLTSLLYLFLHLILIAQRFYYYDLYSTRFTSSTTKKEE